ncbi:unnamed protein product [Urochloa decumbens]|uniref:Plant heme peroxidase family profile domain-containing protein n=1 Tax=Urochloa decumbens TaxID=240449 RepID=A0ABC9E6B9_9POAL
MDHYSCCRLLLVCSVLALCLRNQGAWSQLSYYFYDETCPAVYDIVDRSALGDYCDDNCFDNGYYQNLLNGKGLLSSDQGLFSSAEGVASGTKDLVLAYSDDMDKFINDFGWSLLKMGNIALTGSDGEIRKNCRVVN